MASAAVVTGTPSTDANNASSSSSTTTQAVGTSTAAAPAPKPIMIKRFNVFNSTDTELVQYSAEWCNPCQRVKVHVDKLLSEGKLTKTNEIITDKSKTRPGLIIPFFEVIDKKTQKAIKSIQTSKAEELDVFLDFDTLQFDEDF